MGDSLNQHSGNSSKPPPLTGLEELLLLGSVRLSVKNDVLSLAIMVNDANAIDTVTVCLRKLTALHRSAPAVVARSWRMISLIGCIRCLICQR